MFTQYFGQYLLNQGILTPREMFEVFEREKSTRVKLGVLAINSGYMTAEQVEEIDELYKGSINSFGELAVESGYLSIAQMEELIEIQKKRYLNLSQVLINDGYLTFQQLEIILQRYKEDASIDRNKKNAVLKADYKELVKAYLSFSKEGYYEDVYHEYIALLLKNIVRLLDEYPIISEAYEVTDEVTSKLDGSYVFSQQLIGYNTFKVAFVMDGDMVKTLACKFDEQLIGDEQESCFEDVVGEFLNITNGIFAINMSDVNKDMDLLPQKIGIWENQEFIRDTYVVPIDLGCGKLALILSR